MAQKIQMIKIGKKKFKYNLQSDPDIDNYIIKVYNETLEQLSYYFFTEDMEKWSLVANDDDCVLMTIHGTTENGKVVTKDFYQKHNSGRIEKLSSGLTLEENENQLKWSLDTIQCEEVKEMVSAPNESHPVFILNAAQESNSHTNFYVQFFKDGNTKFISLFESENNEIIDTTIELQSRSNNNIKYKLYKVNKINEQYVVTRVTRETWSQFNLETRNCQKDVEELMEKAISFINTEDLKEYEVKYLYRNKPSSHPTIIKSKKTGIMKKYLKDNNGDRYSSINGNICGLHFSATPKNSWGDLPYESYFGDYRIMIFPEYLVAGCNLYFADFYCMYSDRNHWVLLVLTKRGSKEDKFCQHRLVKLDIKNNPFFYKSGGGYKVKSWNYAMYDEHKYKHTHLYCEILYTEDINLTEMRSEIGFEEEYDIPLRGLEKSTPGGIPKKPSCEICNLPSN